MSRTPWKFCFRESISICLICLLMIMPLNSHQDAGAHRRRHRDLLDIVALDAGRLDRADLLDEGRDVGRQLVLVKAKLADAGVDVAALVGAILDLAGLELTDRPSDVAAGR